MSRAFSFLLGAAFGAVAAWALLMTVMLPAAPPAADEGNAAAPAAPAASPGAGTASGRTRAGTDGARRSSGGTFASIDVGDFPLPGTATGRITGRVIDESGHGLAGVAVVAVPREGPPYLPEPETTDPDEIERRAVRNALRTLRFRRAWERREVTDSAGAFVLDGLGEFDWQLEASLDGWRIKEADNDYAFSPGAAVAFTATREHEAALAVVLPGGAPPESARVIATSPGGRQNRQWRSWTPAEPRIALSAGHWSLEVDAGRDSEFVSKFELDVPSRAEGPLRVELREQPGVAIELGGATDTSPLSVHARLTPDPATLHDGTGNSRREEQDASMAPGDRESWTDLTPGTWTLTLVNGLGDEFHREAIQLGSSFLCRRVEMPRDARDYVVVSVVDPAGSPVSDVSFMSEFVAPGGVKEFDVGSKRLDAGRWRVAIARGERRTEADPEFAQATKWIVRARSPAWGRALAEFEPGARGSEAVIRFDTPAELFVLLQTEAPDGARFGANITRLDVPAPERGRDEEATRADGGLRFGPIRTGRVRVTLSLADGNGNTTSIGQADVELTGGRNEVTLPVPALQEIEVAAPDLAAEEALWLVRIEADGSRQFYQSTDHEWTGRSWGPLPPGSYRLVSDDGDMRVTVPGPSAIRFVPAKFNAARLDVDDDESSRSAGLRTGDVVLAVDGTDLDGRRQIDALLAAAKTRSSARFTLIRDGRKTDVTLNFAKCEPRWDHESR